MSSVARGSTRKFPNPFKDLITTSTTRKAGKNIPYEDHAPESNPIEDSILLVPGMGSTEQFPREQLATACNLSSFDYRSTMKAPYNFLKDKYTKFVTDRVDRLVEQIYDLYVLNGFALNIVCHSHGALLTHRALKILGKKYGKYFTKHIVVATFGPAKLIPFEHRSYVLKNATNYMYENDWIFKRFGNKSYYKKYVKEWNDLRTYLQIKDENIKLIIIPKSGIPPNCTWSSHNCYPVYSNDYLSRTFCKRPGHSIQQRSSSATRKANSPSRPPPKLRGSSTRSLKKSL